LWRRIGNDGTPCEKKKKKKKKKRKKKYFVVGSLAGDDDQPGALDLVNLFPQGGGHVIAVGTPADSFSVFVARQKHKHLKEKGGKVCEEIPSSGLPASLPLTRPS
jgi:hypothetical protein